MHYTKNDILKYLKECKNISEIARKLFNNDNYHCREKVKTIFKNYDINYIEWQKNKNMHFCLYCGKEIIGEKRKRFCNSSCAASFNNKIRNRKKKSKPIRFCSYCGKPLKRTQMKFCSQDCINNKKYYDYIKKWENGEENGISGTSGISKYIRKFLFEKNNYKCQKCGWGEINPTTNKIPLQVHHIDGNCLNNSKENLELLCPNCHSLTPNYGSTNKKSTRVDKRLKRHLQK